MRRTAAAAALRAVPAAFVEAWAAARAVPGALAEAVAAVAGLAALWAQLQLVTVRRTLLLSGGESHRKGEGAGGGDGDSNAVEAANAEDSTDDEKTLHEGEAAAAAAGDGTTRPAVFTPVELADPKTSKPTQPDSRDGEVRTSTACSFGTWTATLRLVSSARKVWVKRRSS